MSNNPAEVYRSTAPEVLELWETYRAKRVEWVDAVADFCKKHSGIDRGWFHHFLNDEYFDGLVVLNREHVPRGWRIDRRHGMMVPNKRTPEGKGFAAEMSKLRKAPSFEPPGMPGRVSVTIDADGRGRTYGFGAERFGDHLEISWFAPVPPERVDLGIWKKIPLSQWHAEREASV